MRAIQAFAAAGVLALVAGACGSSTPTTAPGGATRAGGSASAPAESAAAGQVEIRWYCCLGGGDAPEQVAVEKQVVDEFNASHPHQAHVRGRALRRRERCPGDRDRLRQRPDIVGPVGIGGANAFTGSGSISRP